MAFAYLNAFDLLGDDECDDITVLCDRLKKKTVEEVPSSPRKSRKEYIVFAENADHLEYEEEAHVNGNGVSNKTNVEQDVSNRNGDVAENGITNENDDGWHAVPKKVYGKQVQRNVYEQRTYRNYGRGRRGQGNRRIQCANGDGSEQPKGEGDVNGERPRRYGNWNDHGDRRRGNGGHRGRGRGSYGYRRVDNGEVKEADNVSNGDGANVGQSTVNPEGDAGVTVDSSNGEETVEKQTEEVNGEVPKPEETAEERKEREREEQFRKEKEERQRMREKEEAEEAKKMTLAQYEKILLEKKQALNLQKAEAKRIVAADKDLENMKLVSKKQDNDEILIVEKEKPKEKAGIDKPTSEGKLKKSESFEKKGRKPVAVGLSELFRPASFRGSNGGGRGRGTDRGNKGGLGRRFPSGDGWNSDGHQRNNGLSSAMTNAPAKIPTVMDEHQFPVLGSAPPEPAAESSAPTANPSGPNRSSSGSSSSRSGSRSNRSSSGPNRSNSGYRSSAPANRTSAATGSAPAGC